MSYDQKRGLPNNQIEYYRIILLGLTIPNCHNLWLSIFLVLLAAGFALCFGESINLT
jgi:hypothetical protein